MSISYELLIENVVSGQIGSNNGFYLMARFCERFGGECHNFFNKGRSDDPKTLRHELLLILRGKGKSKVPADIADTIKVLIERLTNLDKKVVTFTNG